MKNKSIISLVLLTLTLCGCKQSGRRADESESIAKPTSEWGEAIDNFTYDNFGGIVIPYVSNDSFEYSTTTDAFGDPLLCIYCFYQTDELADAAGLTYFDECEKDGWACDSGENWGYDETSYEYYSYVTNFADKIVDKNLGIEIQFLTSTYKNKPCLGIFAYTYIYEKDTVYPQVAVEHYLGEEKAKDVPVIEGEGYKYYFEFGQDWSGNTYLEIQVSGPDYDYEETYFNTCLEKGFIMTDNYQEERLLEYPGCFTYSYYYAIDPDLKYGIAFNYDYNYDIFDVQIFLA